MKIGNRDVKKRHVLLIALAALLVLRGLSQSDPLGLALLVVVSAALAGGYLLLKERLKARQGDGL